VTKKSPASTPVDSRDGRRSGIPPDDRERTTVPSKRRSRRLRKKLHTGEFRELGFELALHLDRDLDASADDAFWDAFIVECIEGRGLSYGGSTTGYITRAGHGSASAEDREAVRAWLAQRTELAGFELGPLDDVWYPVNAVPVEPGNP
jgi:uncharacterized protein YggL (DUF469 family)